MTCSLDPRLCAISENQGPTAFAEPAALDGRPLWPAAGFERRRGRADPQIWPLRVWSSSDRGFGRSSPRRISPAKLYQPEFTEVVLALSTPRSEDAVRLRGGWMLGLLIREGPVDLRRPGVSTFGLTWENGGTTNTGLPLPLRRQCGAAGSRPGGYSAGGPGSQGGHRVCLLEHRAPALARASRFQPGNRRRANRPVRRGCHVNHWTVDYGDLRAGRRCVPSLEPGAWSAEGSSRKKSPLEFVS